MNGKIVIFVNLLKFKKFQIVIQSLTRDQKTNNHNFRKFYQNLKKTRNFYNIIQEGPEKEKS